MNPNLCVCCSSASSGTICTWSTIPASPRTRRDTVTLSTRTWRSGVDSWLPKDVTSDSATAMSEILPRSRRTPTTWTSSWWMPISTTASTSFCSYFPAYERRRFMTFNSFRQGHLVCCVSVVNRHNFGQIHTYDNLYSP